MDKDNKCVSEAKELILKLIEGDDRWKNHDEIIGVDYAEEYKRQTGKDLATGEYITQ